MPMLFYEHRAIGRGFCNFFFVTFTKYLAFFLLKCYNAKLRVYVKYLQKGE